MVRNGVEASVRYQAAGQEIICARCADADNVELVGQMEKNGRSALVNRRPLSVQHCELNGLSVLLDHNPISVAANAGLQADEGRGGNAVYGVVAAGGAVALDVTGVQNGQDSLIEGVVDPRKQNLLNPVSIDIDRLGRR
jgi:hypothetical protein